MQWFVAGQVYIETPLIGLDEAPKQQVVLAAGNDEDHIRSVLRCVVGHTMRLLDPRHMDDTAIAKAYECVPVERQVRVCCQRSGSKA